MSLLALILPFIFHCNISRRVLPMSQSLSGSNKEASQSKYHVLIDTDIGDDIDDALALALALSSPEIELHGVTTVFGNTQLRARLAAQLLHVYGCADIPVAAGLSFPLQMRHRPSGVPQAAILNPHVPERISASSAPEFIIQQALAYPNQLTLVCIGPLTNIATALQMEPRLFLLIRSIVMMGGTSGLPIREQNVSSDPLAARYVFSSGIPITLLGINITRRCQMLPGDLERLRASCTQQAQLLYKLLSVWQRHRPRWHPQLPYLHDPLTNAALCAPHLFEFKEITVRVAIDGPLRGFMFPHVLDGPLVHAAVNIQTHEAREWIMQRLVPDK